MKLTYLQIKEWLSSEEAGLSPQQISGNPGIAELIEKFQNHIIPEKPIEEQQVRHDMGQGMCVECNSNWAQKDYNGHNHCVCLSCFNKLSDEFEELFNDFQMYKPVKVARELKDEFHNALSKRFIAMGIDRWEATIYPLKKSYKFQRT